MVSTWGTTLVLGLAAVALANEIALNPPAFVLTNQDGSLNLTNLLAVETSVRVKYKETAQNVVRYKHSKGLTAARARKREDIPLDLRQYAVWTGTIPLGRGNAISNYSVYFDTGSTDFTLADVSCSQEMCGSKKRFDPYSASVKKTGRMTTSNFADGTVSSGMLYRDMFMLGNLFTKGAFVISATSLSSTVARLPSDGMFVLLFNMGLAYPSLSTTFSNSLPFELWRTKNVGSFAMQLSDSPGKAVLTFGPPDPSRYTAPLTWVPVAKSANSGIYSYWQAGQSVAYANGNVASSPMRAIIDSGTSLIIAPPSAAAAFYASIPGSAPLAGDSTHWTFPCASQPTVSFTFGGSSQFFSVAPEDFNLGYLTEDPSKCVGAVVGNNLGLGTSWVLGAAFMKSWYTVFDMRGNRIGFGTPI